MSAISTSWGPRVTSSIDPIRSSGNVRIIAVPAEPNDPVTSLIAARSQTHNDERKKIEVVSPVANIDYVFSKVADTSPIQIWEGEVLSTDGESSEIHARLRSRMGNFPDHDVTISCEWIHEQDWDLIRPGAVFYMTLYKSVRRGSLQNAQEIRFRRLPYWSNDKVEKVYESADELLAKMKEPKRTDGD